MSTVMIQEDMLEQYLTFISGGDEYGIEIRYVKDIVPIPTQAITPVPWVSDFIKGVINLRGTIVPVIDVRMRFNMEPEPYHERTCIIVVELDDISIGMVVDAVKEVLTISSASQVAKPPRLGAMSENRYVDSIASLNEGQGVVLLLDIVKLFYDGEMLPDAVNIS